MISFSLIFTLLASAPICDSGRTPVVFVHGFLGSGDTWNLPCRRFRAAGYCHDRLFVFDWNSTGGKQKSDSLLDLFIDDVLRKTAAFKVDLAGHSAGGGLCYRYLKDSVHAAKVAHYVHIGSGRLSNPAGPDGATPTMVIQSKDDKVTAAIRESPECVNIILEGKDHLETATCDESFRKMYEFFNDGQKAAKPKRENAAQKVRLTGKVLTIGENKPLASQPVYVFYLDPATGQRKKPLADHIVVTDDEGRWPPIFVKPSEFLEFQIRPKNGRAISYFTRPFSEDDPILYLRCLPEAGLVAGIMNKIPEDEKQSVLAIFSANKAIIAGRDSLTVDSIALSTPELMPAEKTSIAAFLFDNGDGMSEYKTISRFGAGIFMSGIDYFIPASNEKYSQIYCNGKTLNIPKRSSKECIQIAIFE